MGAKPGVLAEVFAGAFGSGTIKAEILTCSFPFSVFVVNVIVLEILFAPFPLKLTVNLEDSPFFYRLAFYHFLIENVKPENQSYPYDFFYNNLWTKMKYLLLTKVPK